MGDEGGFSVFGLRLGGWGCHLCDGAEEKEQTWGDMLS